MSLPPLWGRCIVLAQQVRQLRNHGVHRPGVRCIECDVGRSGQEPWRGLQHFNQLLQFGLRDGDGTIHLGWGRRIAQGRFQCLGTVLQSGGAQVARQTFERVRDALRGCGIGGLQGLANAHQCIGLTSHKFAQQAQIEHRVVVGTLQTKIHIQKTIAPQVA